MKIFHLLERSLFLSTLQ